MVRGRTPAARARRPAWSRHGPPTLRQNIAPEPVSVSTVSPFGFPHCSQRSLARSRIRSRVGFPRRPAVEGTEIGTDRHQFPSGLCSRITVAILSAAAFHPFW